MTVLIKRIEWCVMASPFIRLSSEMMLPQQVLDRHFYDSYMLRNGHCGRHSNRSLESAKKKNGSGCLGLGLLR
jgi:hypothetical protein